MSVIESAQDQEQIRSQDEGQLWEVNDDLSNLSFQCASNETLLHAGLAAGLNLPYDCASGGCGVCKSRLISGSIESRFPEAPGLTERDRRKGNIILMCQSEPRSACSLKLQVLNEVTDSPLPRSWQMTITKVVHHNAELLTVVGSIEGNTNFLPGQYMLFSLPGVRGRRAYSMACEPGLREVKFIVKHKPRGAATEFFFNHLREGNVICTEGPYGKAHLREDNRGGIVCIAGGSGLGPMLSIVRSALLKDRVRRIILFYGARKKEDLAYEELLTQMEKLYPSFQVIMALSELKSDEVWDGETGMLNDVLCNYVDELQNKEIYLAGPPIMIETIMNGVVKQASLNLEHIYFDRFI